MFRKNIKHEVVDIAVGLNTRYPGVLTIKLDDIRERKPCEKGWRALNRHINENISSGCAEVSVLDLYLAVGLRATLWVLDEVVQHKNPKAYWCLALAWSNWVVLDIDATSAAYQAANAVNASIRELAQGVKPTYVRKTVEEDLRQVIYLDIEKWGENSQQLESLFLLERIYSGSLYRTMTMVSLQDYDIVTRLLLAVFYYTPDMGD